ncbi:uncharacterized protein [Montipora capricornis]|uniref:uncharacterized protein isoform X1 n=1 Tax=Montipora capricornis TaxID=246305 RepID=UPI0035F13AA3
MAQSKSLDVHVTFGDSTRIVTINEGEGLRELRHNFLRKFSDKLSDEVLPTNIKFLRYNDTCNCYEDLKPDAKVTENEKLLAYLINDESPPISKGTYTLWNPVKNGVIKFEPNNTSVFTNGELGITNAENTVKVKLVGLNPPSKGSLYNLVYNGSPTPYITAAATGTGISLTDNSTTLTEFEAIDHYCYVMFRCESRSSDNTGCYLGCNQRDNLAVLVCVNESYEDPGRYPDPRTLFIATYIDV